MRRISFLIAFTGIFLVLHSGRVPVFEAWVEHRAQPAPMDHERPLVDQDLRGPITIAPSSTKLKVETESMAKHQPAKTSKPAKEDQVLNEQGKVELAHRKEIYRNLAGSMGKFHDATNRKLPQVIPAIFEQDIPNHSDVVIILDHTSSMGDDIESMREMLSELKEKLSSKPGIRIGAVTYSDIKNRPRIGYRSLALGKGMDALDKFLYDTRLIGSIEDMYGAIARTIREFNWRPNAKRTLIVISDEDPAIAPNTTSSPHEVESLCKSTQPETILHTILLKKD